MPKKKEETPEEVQVKPTVPEETPEVSPETKPDVDSLIAELEKFDITTPEQLQNKLAVTREYGQMANLLGDLKRENRELKDLVQKGQSRPAGDIISDFNYNNEPSSIDLEQAIGRALEKDREKQSRQQQQVQEFTLRAYNKITQHRHYPRVKEIFEQKVRDPNTMMQVQMGQMTYDDVYHDILSDYWEGIARKSLESMKVLRGEGAVQPVHVESGSEIPAREVRESAQKEKLNDLTDKVNKGGSLTEDDELDALMATLTQQ